MIVVVPFVILLSARRKVENFCRTLKGKKWWETRPMFLRLYMFMTPRIFFNANGLIQNLESEVARANKLKCSHCGKKGAGLGCYSERCQRSYHVPCAYETSDCRWGFDEFLIFCPKHTSNKFPSEMKSKGRKRNNEKKYKTSVSNAENGLVFCGSDLSSEQKYHLVKFATSNGAIVSKQWRDTVTHVIAAKDSDGACARTFKLLMAILNGKWIVTFEWVKACMEAGYLVKEEPYEVHLDTHGCSGGPKAGRSRILNNGPKLFKNVRFYFIGDFVDDYKTDLITLVTTGGGTISATKDQLLSACNDVDVKMNKVTLVVYNADVSDHSEYESEESIKFQRIAAAEDVAQQYGSRVVGHIWILESVAACNLLPFT
ncbi:BRCA1-associated RING domain protein 1-like isoform X2 [Rutidosis leptorrhynchoides]|uniref:BRCA1-associated RING domain protein 1-like isoform X2 n=1 Tax=Rutidosis leptorrhynchoides TaxID=125765 RepID=UPI003A99D7EE